MNKYHKKIKISKSRWALKSIVVVISIILFLTGKYFYRQTFFTTTTAIVTESELTIIEADGADNGEGVVPRFNKRIEFEFKADNGVTYRSTLRSPRNFWANPGQELPIEYKISNPEICYLN